MNKLEQLEQLFMQELEGTYELLELQMQNAQGQPVLLSRVDRLDERPVTVEDLQNVTRRLSALLDDEANDPVKGRYRLEVESPGAKRPLKRARHFERMLGLKAKVRGTDNKGRTQSFTAPIEAIKDGFVVFDVPGEGETYISLDDITSGNITANLAEFPSEHR